MTADLIKCLSLSMQILLTDDSRLDQISISVQILLTDDSRFDQMSVYFYANSAHR